jgi:hypothetical protein
MAATSTPPPNLHGVWAKWERATEQLQGLSEQIVAFSGQPHAWTIVSQVDVEHEHYTFRLQPAWPGATVRRWGAIIGEIIHDYRSALDQLVWQLVRLNEVVPDKGHAFPVCSSEPQAGFASTMRKVGDSGKRHGSLFGLSDQALAVIEACQPYHGQDAALLGDLHRYWNIGKHQTLVPTALWFKAPTLKLTNTLLVDRADRFEDDAYVVEVTGLPGSSPPIPNVDLEPHTPNDVAFRDGRPVIEHLRDIGKFVLTRILIPASDLFPDIDGVAH